MMHILYNRVRILSLFVKFVSIFRNTELENKNVLSFRLSSYFVTEIVFLLEFFWTTCRPPQREKGLEIEI